jgi:hypothetical protein
MSFSNLVLDRVTGPISINVGQQPRRQQQGNASSSQSNSSSVQQQSDKPAGIVRNISFSNIHGTVVVPVQLSDVPFTSAYRPGEMKSCISLNCVEGTIEKITLSDVHLTFPGGGTQEEAAVRDVPRVAGEYFETGILPSYALFARNVRALTMSNVRFEVASAEARPAVVFDHVEDASINAFGMQGTAEEESVLRFIDTREVLLTASRLLSSTAVFLQVEGSGNSNITLDGGDLSRATKPVAFKSGATDTVVRVRA